MQCRLIYRSVAEEEVISNEDLRSLAEKSAESNAESGITGLLVYTGQEFLQVLEGPEVAVNALFQRICRDKRHGEIRLLTFEPTGQVYFEDWGMRLVDLFDMPGEVRALFLSKYEQEDGELRLPERLHAVYALLLDAKALGRGEF